MHLQRCLNSADAADATSASAALCCITAAPLCILRTSGKCHVAGVHCTVAGKKKLLLLLLRLQQQHPS
jgi:hypothetical protein